MIHPLPSLDKRGFTLIELLVVIGILGLLVAVSMPAMNAMLDSNNLTRAGQSIADQIGLARQIASARNRAVDIRFVKLAKLKNPNARGYDAIQLWSTNSAGNPTPMNKLTPMPDGIVIAEDSTELSRALDTSAAIAGTIPANNGIASNAEFVALQIRPSGLVTPTLTMDKLYVTVMRTKDANGTELPNNYITIQINPNTGTPLIFRP